MKEMKVRSDEREDRRHGMNESRRKGSPEGKE